MNIFYLLGRVEGVLFSVQISHTVAQGVKTRSELTVMDLTREVQTLRDATDVFQTASSAQMRTLIVKLRNFYNALQDVVKLAQTQAFFSRLNC